jgi:hypothetical protein
MRKIWFGRELGIRSCADGSVEVPTVQWWLSASSTSLWISHATLLRGHVKGIPCSQDFQSGLAGVSDAPWLWRQC